MVVTNRREVSTKGQGGTWQEIMLLEFDTRPRRREYVIQIVGD